MSFTPSTFISQGDANRVCNMVSQCCGLTALLQAYIVGQTGNEASEGHLLSGLGMLQLVLEDLQECLDPNSGLFTQQGEVRHARN